MPQDQGTTSNAGANASAIAIAPLGGLAAIVSWTQSGDQATRRGFRLLHDGQPVPPPATHCSITHGGIQRHLLAVPMRSARLAQGRMEVVALDGTIVAQSDRAGLHGARPFDFDPLGMVPELDPRDAIRVVRFLLEIAPSLFRLGRDDGYLAFARALVEIVAATPEPLAARCCAGPFAVFETGAHRGIGDRLSAVLVTRVGVSRVMTAPRVLPHPHPQRGLARIALAVDRASIGPESCIVVLGEGGIACRRLPSTEPPLSAFERANRDGAMDASLRNFIVDALAAVDDPAVATAALIRELRAATGKLQASAPSGAIAGGLDLVLPSANGTLVSGWLADPHRLVDAVTLQRHERRTHVPVAKLLRFRHPVADRDQPGACSGFIFTAQSGNETSLLATVQLQIRLGSGETIALGDGPTQIDPRLAITRALDTLAGLPDGGIGALPAIAPVLHALSAAQGESPALDIVDIGRRKPAAKASLIVPVGTNLELVRLRFAALALDPTVAEDAEIIHVVADPQRADAVAAMLRTTAQVYGHGTRLAVASRACGIEAAVNAVAAASEAPLLVLVGAHSMPIGTDWLAPMLHALDANPRAGLVAARRVGGDLSIVDCGLDRETDGDGRTRFVSRLAGFPATFPAARQDASVAACARGAWLVRRSLFELVGGLGTDPLTSLGTDLDFSCRVRAAGFELRQLAAPDLLEIDDATAITRDALALEIDQRLLLERWPFRPLGDAMPGSLGNVTTIQSAADTADVPSIAIDGPPSDAQGDPAAHAVEHEADKKRPSGKRRTRKSRRAA
jgi:GT2 family glycosyltransferase